MIDYFGRRVLSRSLRVVGFSVILLAVLGAAPLAVVGIILLVVAGVLEP